MPIYKILFVNNSEKWSSWEFENFTNNDEIIAFRRINEVDGDKINILEPAESLTEILALKMRNDYNNVSFYFDELCEKFDLNFIKNQFPNEMFNRELIDKVEAIYDEMQGELMAEYYESDDYKKTIYYPENSAEISAGEEEMRRWDDETDGSWRRANDFG